MGNPILTLKLVKLEQQHLEKSMYNVSLEETSKDVQDNPDTETGKDIFFYSPRPRINLNKKELT